MMFSVLIYFVGGVLLVLSVPDMPPPPGTTEPGAIVVGWPLFKIAVVLLYVGGVSVVMWSLRRHREFGSVAAGMFIAGCGLGALLSLAQWGQLRHPNYLLAMAGLMAGCAGTSVALVRCGAPRQETPTEGDT